MENFEKSQKPKKGLKRKIITWALGLGIFAGAAAGGVMAYKSANSDEAKYIKEIKSRYEKVDDALTIMLNRYSSYRDLSENKKIDTIKFNDPGEEDVELEVYFEGDMYNSVWEKNFSYNGSATFKVLLNYYNSLVEAEQSNNMITYLDSLQEVFKNMQYKTSEIHDKISFLSNIEKTEENFAKINEVFKLDITNPDIIRQVGFLPYNISLVQNSYDETDPEHAYKYTYKLSGISYCETRSENSEKIELSDDLLLESNYNKKHIKAYYRDIIIKGSEPIQFGRPDFSVRLAGDMYMICANADEEEIKTLEDFEVNTTFFQETTIFDDFLNMKNTQNFNYKMPQGLNMNDYL